MRLRSGHAAVDGASDAPAHAPQGATGRRPERDRGPRVGQGSCATRAPERSAGCRRDSDGGTVCFESSLQVRVDRSQRAEQNQHLVLISAVW